MESKPEATAKAEPKATHEVKVIRADGTEEVVGERDLSPDEAQALLEKLRREVPEMVAEAEASALRARAKERGEIHG